VSSDFNLGLRRKNAATCLSEILSSFLSCHQEFLLDNLRGKRALDCEDELKVTDDPINDFMIFD